MAWFSDLRNLIRTLDGLLEVERRHDALINNLRDRLLRLEAAEPVLIAEAKAAAATAASAVAAQHVADLARRVGVLEEQMRRRSPTRRLTED